MHSRCLIKVLRFYKSRSDHFFFFKKPNKPQNWALLREGQMCSLHKLILAVNIPFSLCCSCEHAVLLMMLCFNTTASALPPPQALK